MFVSWCGDNSQSYMMGPERLVNTIVINISGSAERGQRSLQEYCMSCKLCGMLRDDDD